MTDGRVKVLVVAPRIALPEDVVEPHGAGAHLAATLAGLREHFDVFPVAWDGGRAAAAGAVRSLRRWVPALIRGARQDLLFLREDERIVRRALRDARLFRPDVLYVRSEYFSLAGMRLRRALELPLVLEVNGLLAADARSMYRSLLEPVGALLERAKLRRADAVVTVSPGLARRLVDGGARAERVAVIPNSVPPDRVRTTPRAVRDGGVVIGWIGHLMRWHVEALEALVDAAPDVARRAPDARFLVVGGGPGLETVRRRAEALGVGERFTFAGSVPYEAVPGVLEEVDVGVIPAVFDYAFPVKLVEMGAAGLPVVSPRSASLDELLEPGAEYEPFEAGNRHALVQALVGLALDPHRRMVLGAALHAAVRERFTWTATGRALSDVVGRVVAERGRVGRQTLD